MVQAVTSKISNSFIAKMKMKTNNSYHGEGNVIGLPIKTGTKKRNELTSDINFHHVLCSLTLMQCSFQM